LARGGRGGGWEEDGGKDLGNMKTDGKRLLKIQRSLFHRKR